jgi:hypothetical protein
MMQIKFKKLQNTGQTNVDYYNVTRRVTNRPFGKIRGDILNKKII